MALKKHLGRDCELSTTGSDANRRAFDSWWVTKKVLAQVDPALRQRGGMTWSRNSSSWSTSAFSMDCLRQWTSAGQCLYSDMAHVEVCGASVTRPRDFAAQCISLLMLAEQARILALQEEDDGSQFNLTASNADILDPAVSWGTHLNVSVTSDLWEDLFVDHSRPARLGFVASTMAAAIPFFGCGYLMPLKDGTTIFSLSARAHHLAKVHTHSTTEAWKRGLLNTRREAFAKDYERLHLIGFDYCFAAAPLLASFLQTALAAAEEGFCGLNLYDPVRALRTWSWNLDMRTGELPAEATLVDGRKLTLPGYMRELCTRLLEMCESGLISEEVAPEATELLPRIIELTRYAEEGSVQRCAMHLDWAAKLMFLLAREQPLGDADCRLADHDFTNTNPQRGAIWRLWEEEMIDPLVDRSDVEKCLVEPPSDTRAWARGQLITRFRDQITDVDWDCVELQYRQDRWGRRLKVEMPRIDGLNRQKFSRILDRARSVEHLRDLLERQQNGSVEESDPIDDITGQLATLQETNTHK